MSHTTYAIGDVHGRADLLEALLKRINMHSRSADTEPRVIFLGDIVDRGPESCQAMDLVCDTLAMWPRSRLVLGNHDSYFLDLMTADTLNPNLSVGWLKVGGNTTLLSYGVACPSFLSLSEVPELIAEARRIIRRDYEYHLATLSEAVSMVVDERFLYVHAGIDPDRSLEQQVRKDLYMIRDKFLDHEGELSHVVVHGHSVTKSLLPETKRWRVAIDTGAYRTGRLTCLAVSEDESRLEFISAIGSGNSVEVSVSPCMSTDAGHRMHLSAA